MVQVFLEQEGRRESEDDLNLLDLNLGRLGERFGI